MLLPRGHPRLLKPVRLTGLSSGLARHFRKLKDLAKEKAAPSQYGVLEVGVVVTVVASRIAHLGLVVLIPFAIAAAYLTIVILRWVLGRKNL